jgi:biotin transport system substrate-specific component
MQPEAVRSTLIDALLPAAGLPAWARKALLALAGSLLLTLSVKINVPFYPVPMTMQTFAVLVIGAAFGWRLGAATVLISQRARWASRCSPARRKKASASFT